MSQKGSESEILQGVEDLPERLGRVRCETWLEGGVTGSASVRVAGAGLSEKSWMVLS